MCGRGTASSIPSVTVDLFTHTYLTSSVARPHDMPPKQYTLQYGWAKPRVMLGKFIAPGGVHNDGTEYPDYSTLNGPLNMFQESVDGSKVNAPRVKITVMPDGGDQTLSLEVSMADKVNDIMKKCCLVMGQFVLDNYDEVEREKKYEHYLYLLKRANVETFAPELAGQLLKRYPRIFEAGTPITKEAAASSSEPYDDKKKRRYKSYFPLFLGPNSWAFYHGDRTFTDYAINETKPFFMLMMYKPKRHADDGRDSIMTTARKETRWYIQDADEQRLFEGVEDGLDVSQESFILKLNERTRTAQLFPFKQCYRFKKVRTESGLTNAAATSGLEKEMKKKTAEFRNLFLREKVKEAERNGTERGGGQLLDFQPGMSLDDLAGRETQYKKRPTNVSSLASRVFGDGKGKKVRAFAGSVAAPRRKGRAVFSDEDSDEDSDEFSGYLLLGGAKERAELDDAGAEVQEQYTDDSGDEGGSDNSDNQMEDLQDENLFSESEEEEDETGAEEFMDAAVRDNKKLLKLDAKKEDRDKEVYSEHEEDLFSSSEDEDEQINVEDFLESHSQFMTKEQEIARKAAERKKKEEEEAAAAALAGAPAPPVPTPVPIAPRPKADKRKADAMAEGGSQVDPGSAPPKRKKKKVVGRKVALSEKSFLDVMNTAGGSMPFKQLLSSFKNITKEKAFFTELREKFCILDKDADPPMIRLK